VRRFILAGSSGCPILDKNNFVVAVHSGRRTSGGRSYNAAPILDEGLNDIGAMQSVLNAFATSTNIGKSIVYRLGNDGAKLFEMHHL
jgi:hypothetical protein